MMRMHSNCQTSHTHLVGYTGKGSISGSTKGDSGEWGSAVGEKGGGTGDSISTSSFGMSMSIGTDDVASCTTGMCGVVPDPAVTVPTVDEAGTMPPWMRERHMGSAILREYPSIGADGGF
jgi:hypothetical protein